ncbi:MAG: hypothetical protein J6Y35_03910 [Bacteroidales bacterium]|nr:hypothetical protein [Bacteroidales bacterium]
MITLNVDYLDFNASLTDEAFPKFDFPRGFETESFVFSDKCADSTFQYHYHVYQKGSGEFIGLFMACNRPSQGKEPTDRQKRISKFRFADALFYKTFDFNETHDKLCNEIGMISKGVSQVDICFDTDEAVFFKGWSFNRERKTLKACDGGGFTGLDFMLAAKYDLLKRDRRFNRSKMRVVDNMTKTQLKELLSDNCMDFKGRTSNIETQTLEIGAKKSRCMARLYNKTIEMQVNGEKTFITELWKNAGYDGEKPVYRFEISLKRLAEEKSYFYTEDGEYIEPTLNDFFDPDFRRGLFDGVITDKFVFAGDLVRHKEYVWQTCLSKDTDLSYNCGYVK